MCKRDDSRGKILLWSSWVLTWGTVGNFPYNRNDAISIPFLLSRLLGPPRGGKIVRLFDTGLSVIVVCLVVSSSLIPGPETIDTTSLIESDELSSKCF